MVSLARDESRQSGGYFFTEDPSIQNHDAEGLITDSSVLVATSEPKSKKIHTTFAIIVHILLVLCLLVCVFVLPYVCYDSKCGEIQSFAVVVYIIGGTWFIMLLLDRFYRCQHNASRLYGYLDFYRKTRHIRRIPLLISSATCAILLIVIEILEHFQCNKPTHCVTFKQENYLQIIVSISCVLQLICLIIFFVQTVKFNSSGAYPDVNREEMMTSFVQSQTSGSDVGFKDENFTDQVLDKQADMIRYLKQHNAQLAKRILTLTAENTALKSK